MYIVLLITVINQDQSAAASIDWFMAVALTKQVSREVDWQDDTDREDADHNQEANDVTLEGQVVHGVLATLLPDLLVPAARPLIRPTSCKAFHFSMLTLLIRSVTHLKLTLLS